MDPSLVLDALLVLRFPADKFPILVFNKLKSALFSRCADQINGKFSFTHGQNEWNVGISSKWRHSLITYLLYKQSPSTKRIWKIIFDNIFDVENAAMDTKNIDENARKTTKSWKAKESKKKKINYHNSKVSTHIQRTHTSQTNTKHEPREGMWRRTYLVQLGHGSLTYVHIRDWAIVYITRVEICNPLRIFHPWHEVRYDRVSVCTNAHVFRCMHHEKAPPQLYSAN